MKEPVTVCLSALPNIRVIHIESAKYLTKDLDIRVVGVILFPFKRS